MGLSRIGWFSFAGITVTNLDFDLATPKLVSIDRPCSPTMQYDEFTAPYRHGSRYYDNRYDDLEIKVVIGFNGTATERQAKITNLLQQWIGKEDKLIFADRPNLFYKARFYKSVTSKDSGTFTQITITFIASFCLYELNYDETDFNNDIPIRAIYTSSGTYPIRNHGQVEAHSVIEITGVASNVILTFRDAGFNLSNLDGTVYIDSEDMVVYSLNENNKKVSKMLNFKGKFPMIVVGDSNLTVSITGTATIKLRFRNTYIV